MTENEFVLSTTDGDIVVFTAGRGETVVILTGSRSDQISLDSLAAGEASLSPGVGAGRFGALATSLSETRQVFSLSPGGRVSADALITALRRHGIERMGIVGFGADAALALEIATKAVDAVTRLVLISPLDAKGHDLASVVAPTLVVVGTSDTTSATETARAIRAGISNSNLSFIYDAGPDVVRDRPAVCHATVEDFLQRGGAYVVRRSTMAIHP